MSPLLKRSFNLEMEQAQALFELREYQDSFKHLERAHVLGQYYIIPHTQTHFWMLKIGLKQRNLIEVLAQIIRIPGGIIGSAIGVLPTGNTGGSNISAFKKLPISNDLQKILDSDND